MKRNIYISSLALILLVSTTGLTYTLHLCKMMSAEEAELCEMEDMKMMSGCCNDENDNGAILKNYQPDCCEFQTVENRISDEFLIVKSETIRDYSLSFDIVNTELLNDILQYNSFNKCDLHNNSPPARVNNLFKINSSFLI